MKENTRRRQAAWGILVIGILAFPGCTSTPEECGENVQKVVSIDFSGPSVIPTTPEYDFAAYDVTITIDKNSDDEPSQVCYAVRDEDPWYKGPWGVDDVLDANIMNFPVGVNTRTLEETFVLWAKNDNEVCGAGALPGDLKVEGCSGEKKAEVYLDPRGSAGQDSPKHDVRVD